MISGKIISSQTDGHGGNLWKHQQEIYEKINFNLNVNRKIEILSSSLKEYKYNHKIYIIKAKRKDKFILSLRSDYLRSRTTTPTSHVTSTGDPKIRCYFSVSYRKFKIRSLDIGIQDKTYGQQKKIKNFYVKNFKLNLDTAAAVSALQSSHIYLYMCDMSNYFPRSKRSKELEMKYTENTEVIHFKLVLFTQGFRCRVKVFVWMVGVLGGNCCL